MLPFPFIAQNFHFALNLFGGLASFGVVWLYFTAWKVRRERKELAKWLGFLLIGVSFLLHATLVEQPSLTLSSFFGATTDTIGTITRLVGYLLVAYGQLIDPLPQIPREDKSTPKEQVFFPPVWLTSLASVKFLVPIGSFAIAAFYFRRATRGLERQIKPVALAFLLIAAADLLSLLAFLRGSEDLILYNLVSPFGLVWLLEHLLLAAGLFVLARWVWFYLLKRFETQLSMIFATITMAIFLTITIGFTFVLLKNIESATLGNLESAAKTLGFSVESKKAETLALAEGLAQNTDIRAAMQVKDHERLVSLTEDFLTTKSQSRVVATDTDGQVLVRAEDPDRWGDSLAEDPLLTRALIGQARSSIDTVQGVVSPSLFVQSAVPVRDEAKRIIGMLLVGLALDNSFLDGVKSATGLESAVFAGNVRSATTLLSPDGKSRQIGIKEEHPAVNEQVLQKGKVYSGSLLLTNTLYLAVYTPLLDVDNIPVGMLFVGSPQIATIAAAARSIELTFFLTALLLLLSLLPAHKVAQYIAYQVR